MILSGRQFLFFLPLLTGAHWIRPGRTVPELYRAMGTIPYRSLTSEVLMVKKGSFPKVLLGAANCVRIVERVGAKEVSG